MGVREVHRASSLSSCHGHTLQLCSSVHACSNQRLTSSSSSSSSPPSVADGSGESSFSPLAPFLRFFLSSLSLHGAVRGTAHTLALWTYAVEYHNQELVGT